MIGSFQKLSCGLSRNFLHPIFRFSPSKFRIVLYPENSLIAQSLVPFVTSLCFYMTVSNVQTDRQTYRKKDIQTERNKGRCNPYHSLTLLRTGQGRPTCTHGSRLVKMLSPCSVSCTGSSLD